MEKNKTYTEEQLSGAKTLFESFSGIPEERRTYAAAFMGAFASGLEAGRLLNAADDEKKAQLQKAAT